MKSFLAKLFRRRPPPQPGRFALRQKASLHGLINVAAAPPWREYLLYLPRGMERLPRPPLVVWIHGCRQDPEEFAAGTRITRYADERGFVVLLPRQNRLANAERCWNWFDRRTARGLGETAIIAAQATQVLESFNLDRRRVYVAGLSSGGALAGTLALHAPRLVRAVAIHSGVACGVANDAADAAQLMAHGAKRGADEAALQARVASHGEARVPALIIHGAADTAVAPVNALHLARQFLLFNGFDPAALPKGAALPRAGMLPLPFFSKSERPDGDYYVGRRLAARLVTIPGLAHAWSGGDPAHAYFDGAHLEATRLICDFFAAH